MSETIVTGKKYRILSDATSKLWNRISFWTHSSDVEMPDGNSCATNLGSIKGITTSTDITQTGYAADASVVSELHDNLTASNGISFKFAYDSSLGQYGYVVTDASTGADTFSPFSTDNDGIVVNTHHHTHSGTAIQNGYSQSGGCYTQVATYTYSYQSGWKTCGHNHVDGVCTGGVSNCDGYGHIPEYSTATATYYVCNCGYNENQIVSLQVGTKLFRPKSAS